MLALVTKDEADAGSPLGAARVLVTAWCWRKVDLLGVALCYPCGLVPVLGSCVQWSDLYSQKAPLNVPTARVNVAWAVDTTISLCPVCNQLELGA